MPTARSPIIYRTSVLPQWYSDSCGKSPRRGPRPRRKRCSAQHGGGSVAPDFVMRRSAEHVQGVRGKGSSGSDPTGRWEDRMEMVRTGGSTNKQSSMPFTGGHRPRAGYGGKSDRRGEESGREGSMQPIELTHPIKATDNGMGRNILPGTSGRPAGACPILYESISCRICSAPSASPTSLSRTSS